MIFEFIRIGILSLIYGYLSWYILVKLFDFKNIKKKYLIPIIFISLFVWRNSYWRNNGYGDFGRVPLTSEYEITMIDFWIGSIVKNGENIKQEGITNGITKLYFENEILYAKSENYYLIFNTKKENLESMNLKVFLEKGGKIEKLLSPDNFHSDYWGWKILFI
jgi:hypothetical protein